MVKDEKGVAGDPRRPFLCATEGAGEPLAKTTAPWFRRPFHARPPRSARPGKGCSTPGEVLVKWSYATLVAGGGGAAGGGAVRGRITMPTIIPTPTPISEPISCVSTSLFMAQFTA